MTLGAMDIQVSDHNIRSQVRLSLCIDNCLYYLFKDDSFLILLFYLNFNTRLEAFWEIADYSKLIRNPDKIKLY